MSKKALLIIDIQDDYFSGGAMELVNSEQAARQAQKVLKAFREKNLPVIHIQHIALGPTAAFFLPGTKGAEINNAVTPLSNEKIIIKHYPNSFRETELQQYLQKQNITQLVVCGMMSHMCVDAGIRAAADLGYHVALVQDACATKNLTFDNKTVKAADVHTAFMAALNGTYADIVNAGALAEEIKNN